MIDALMLLGFVSIFQIIGGIALGWVLRRLLARQFSATEVFFIIWGSGFGLAPFLIGASSFSAMHAPYLILIQVAVSAAAIAVTAFTPQEYLLAFASLPFIFIAFGGVILLIGAAVFIGMVRQDAATAAIIGLVFGLVGGVLLAVGVYTAAKNR